MAQKAGGDTVVQITMDPAMDSKWPMRQRSALSIAGMPSSTHFQAASAAQLLRHRQPAVGCCAAGSNSTCLRSPQRPTVCRPGKRCRPVRQMPTSTVVTTVCRRSNAMAQARQGGALASAAGVPRPSQIPNKPACRRGASGLEARGTQRHGQGRENSSDAFHPVVRSKGLAPAHTTRCVSISPRSMLQSWGGAEYHLERSAAATHCGLGNQTPHTARRRTALRRRRRWGRGWLEHSRLESHLPKGWGDRRARLCA